MQLRLLQPLVALALAACAGTQERAPLKEPGTPAHPSLLVPADFDFQPRSGLTAQDVQKDVDVLVYALNNAYGGKEYVAADGLRQAMESLRRLPGKAGPSYGSMDLCQDIDRSLLLVQDMHMRARLGPEPCDKARREHQRVPSVGPNIAHSSSEAKGRPWFRTQREVNGVPIPVISIVGFQKSEDPSWDGFLKAVEDAKNTAPAIILDVRGNDGGDDTMARQMATILYGQDFPTPVEEIIASQTAATMALKVNQWTLRINRSKQSGKPIPDYFWTRYGQSMFQYQLAAAGKLHVKSVEKMKQGPAFSPDKGFTKPIYVLMDAACASSCESIMEIMEGHPHVRTVGENTAGLVHFGNVGMVGLPNSHVPVQMATDYWRFKDGRFLEGIGYTPTLPSKPGTDALDTALADLAANMTASPKTP